MCIRDSRREEAADALARGLVASLATPLERVRCDDDAHGDVAVEGAEGEEASSSSCCVQLSGYPLHVPWLRRWQERGFFVLTVVRSPVVHPSDDVIIPVM